MGARAACPGMPGSRPPCRRSPPMPGTVGRRFSPSDILVERGRPCTRIALPPKPDVGMVVEAEAGCQLAWKLSVVRESLPARRDGQHTNDHGRIKNLT